MLTSARNTLELHANAVKYDYLREAGAQIYAGALTAQNAAGKAVPAADAEGLVVLGRAETTCGQGCKTVVRRGAFLYDNSEEDPLTTADIGAVCYVADDSTVNKTGGVNKIKAGFVLDVIPEGVAVLI